MNDVVYVWHHSDGGEPDWEPDIIDNIHNNKWVCLARTEYNLDCHIQVLTDYMSKEIEENWTDLAHFVTLHTPLYYPFNALNRFQECLQKFISFGIRTNWTSINEPKHYNAMASIDALTTIFGYNTWAMNFQFRQVGPATLVITYDQPDLMGGVSGCLVQYVNPVEPNKVRFILRNYCDRGFRARIFAKVLNFFEIFMIERDMIVWNNKKFVKNAKYTKMDKPIAQFRRWYTQYYSDKNDNLLDW
ncbi:unnamed protein product [Oppiella nova]|uniref:3-ketosteroid-9-alpha-monooxygenase oxygenase component-like C-terminal domain-containing protein n=1 Tax=Oppiella nova TaxID=334625 RepID=A0A7R9MGP3_9ACAR|nr:unnamed protein product [Oppiella nova]CAG2176064.1 unnamed protein product [Oppiella nova]